MQDVGERGGETPLLGARQERDESLRAYGSADVAFTGKRARIHHWHGTAENGSPMDPGRNDGGQSSSNTC
eukprot:5385361-Alexandrium_andersonii.AAC.1